MSGAAGADGPPDAPAGVVARGLTRSFDGATRVLDGVDVDVAPGATLALLGPSGCGKTTLLRILAGLEVPDSGTVAVGDRVVTGPGEFVPPERRRIGMVFQDWALFPHLSVARNVGFGLARGERRASPRIDEALELVGLAGLGDRMPATLSGGQQQRVALARAIAPRPSVLLLDEPFSNLDAALRARVRTEIHALLVGLGITTVFVTHDQDEAFVLGDRVAVLSGGRVAQVGTPAEVYLRPADRWVAEFVGDANLLRGRVDGSVARTAVGAVPIEPVPTAPGPTAPGPTGPAPAAGVGPGVEDVEVLARPEHLDLEPVADGVAGDDVGPVELVEYVGHDTTYLVGLPAGTVRVRLPSSPVVARGDRVRVSHRGAPSVAYALG